MKTTLVQELEQAADDADILARMVTTMGRASEVVALSARATRLRQRAAWVREVDRESAERLKASQSKDLTFLVVRNWLLSLSRADIPETKEPR